MEMSVLGKGKENENIQDVDVSTSYRVRVLARIRPLLNTKKEHKNQYLRLHSDTRVIKCGDSSYTYDGILYVFGFFILQGNSARILIFSVSAVNLK